MGIIHPFLSNIDPSMVGLVIPLSFG